jgi:DNA-binding response OmpR family regulator
MARAKASLGDGMNSNKKFLVICHDADLSDLYQEILQTYGFSFIDTVETVSKSARFLENNVYDTVILDCKDLNGELRNLKKIVKDNTKLLCVTSCFDDPDLSSLENAVSITKPFNIDSFYKRISC